MKKFDTALAGLCWFGDLQSLQRLSLRRQARREKNSHSTAQARPPPTSHESRRRSFFEDAIGEVQWASCVGEYSTD